MKKLESQLKEVKKATVARADFKAALWSDLEVEFERTYPSSLIFWRRAFVLPLAMMVIFVSTGTGVYAYASPSVTQNHGLYMVKRGIESMEGVLPRSPESAAQFHIRMMDRRIAEGEFMSDRHKLHTDTLTAVANELERVMTEMEYLDDDADVRMYIFEQMQEQTDGYGNLIEALVRERHEDMELHREFIRNNYTGIRVHISESQLSDGEKDRLLYRLDFNQDAPRSFDFESTR